MAWAPRSNPLLGFWYKLYTKMTECEVMLEPHLAALGKPYRAQHLDMHHRVVMDFAWLSEKVCFEIDDPGHLLPDKVKKDSDRTARLEADGWTVVRVTNAEVKADPGAAMLLLLERLKDKRKERYELGYDSASGTGADIGGGGNPDLLGPADQDKGRRRAAGKAGRTAAIPRKPKAEGRGAKARSKSG